MEFQVFVGVLAAVLIGNGLSVCFFYALIWGDAQKRRGRDEADFPLWWFAAGLIPPLVGGVSAYVALY